ncbi:MAG: hypothetical protein ACRENE_05675, partial [Polyangiaceae bacterium]
LAHSASLADLRIRDASGHQVPYLLEHREEPTVVSLAMERIDKDAPEGLRVDPRSSLYRITLPFSSLPAGRLVLSTTARVFQRRLALMRPRPPGASQREPAAMEVGPYDWTHADSDSPAPALGIALSAPDASTLYLRVDEGDNAPLPIVSARYELPGVRLRFYVGADRALTLLYGSQGLGAPTYDLSLLAPRLVGEAAEELNVGPETANAAAVAPAPPPGMRAFWAVLAGAVVILLVLLGRLLRAEAGT